MPRATRAVSWVMPDLSSSNAERLLQLARRSIEIFLKTREAPDARDLLITLGLAKVSELAEPRACFVTLRKKNELRGCVGTFETGIPLYQNVSEMTVAAASRDPRFPPVAEPELANVRLEISILGPMRLMTSLEQLEIGRHGVYVVSGQKSGTYLPEVALGQGWSVQQFIAHCALEKAGLSAEELREAQIFIYEVEKICEKE